MTVRMINSQSTLKLRGDLLLQLDPYKYMEPDGIHPRTLKELADVTTKPPFMIFECSWESREVPADWKLANIVPRFQEGQEGGPQKLQACQSHFNAWQNYGEDYSGKY
ncbi:solute carrier family 12 member 2 [Willisornis vidua]|uniref:Solute carrier family 12 member 2 n=1 Tax=Willisornis vidua TaxID=1566151 RepID=A0ABQ9CMD4_9PASS|nr:solute carrier family 12 member 2 [Willisornis vidua]